MTAAVAGVTPVVTPNADFYRIDTALAYPQIDYERWRVRIHGMVRTPGTCPPRNGCPRSNSAGSISSTPTGCSGAGRSKAPSSPNRASTSPNPVDPCGRERFRLLVSRGRPRAVSVASRSKSTTKPGGPPASLTRSAPTRGASGTTSETPPQEHIGCACARLTATPRPKTARTRLPDPAALPVTTPSTSMSSPEPDPGRCSRAGHPRCLTGRPRHTRNRYPLTDGWTEYAG